MNKLLLSPRCLPHKYFKRREGKSLVTLARNRSLIHVYLHCGVLGRKCKRKTSLMFIASESKTKENKIEHYMRYGFSEKTCNYF